MIGSSKFILSDLVWLCIFSPAIDAVAHLECSAKTKDGVRLVFEAAARAALCTKKRTKRTCKPL